MRKRICRKAIFNTRKEARQFTSKKYGKPYKCDICGNWHLGHKLPKKDPRAIEKKKHERSMDKLLDLIDEICGELYN